jgi:hypothetical protein
LPMAPRLFERVNRRYVSSARFSRCVWNAMST